MQVPRWALPRASGGMARCWVPSTPISHSMDHASPLEARCGNPVRSYSCTLGSCGCLCCVREAKRDPEAISSPASPELLTLYSSCAPAPFLAEPSPRGCNCPDAGLRLTGGPEDRLAAACAALSLPIAVPVLSCPARAGAARLPLVSLLRHRGRPALQQQNRCGNLRVRQQHVLSRWRRSATSYMHRPRQPKAPHGAGAVCPVPWACKGSPWEGDLAAVSPGWAFSGPAGCLASASLLRLAEQVLEQDQHWPGCPVHRDERVGLQRQHKAG